MWIVFVCVYIVCFLFWLWDIFLLCLLNIIDLLCWYVFCCFVIYFLFLVLRFAFFIYGLVFVLLILILFVDIFILLCGVFPFLGFKIVFTFMVLGLCIIGFVFVDMFCYFDIGRNFLTTRIYFGIVFLCFYNLCFLWGF